MLLSMLLLATIVQSDVPPVPGLCIAPVPADRETLGCYQTSELDLVGAPAKLYWHILEYPTLETANAEASRHRRAAVAAAHSRYWLYILGRAAEPAEGGIERAVIGPLRLPIGHVIAHFSEAIFPPGMRTRVHSHPGPEAFYIVEGEQCMETPSDKRKIGAGGTYIVPSGVHLQAAPRGRRNLVLIIAPKGVPFVIPGGGQWTPTGFCR
ncbi:cupin domain-containing protein [Sphingomonas sp. PP-CE-1G-424]|uniref:cupin domain-containing protein n=1 Tax=Sphingomonas sp. PP-CE-1G-424 TaxID=2135658 RepID=UPI00105656A3|nr:cupin domain-containing protein [Sphingomonas sp. PP-CE-1G-424]TCP67382.1 hypothetical protein C8J43_10322 [Sphingomonas sp. PP-CE-1G-424]